MFLGQIPSVGSARRQARRIAGATAALLSTTFAWSCGRAGTDRVWEGSGGSESTGSTASTGGASSGGTPSEYGGMAGSGMAGGMASGARNGSDGSGGDGSWKIEFDEEPQQKSPRFAGLSRGVTLGNALEAPNEGEWGVVLSERHFDMARAAPLDHVRLPVRVSAHAEREEPYTIDEAFLDRMDWAIDQAFVRELGVVLCFAYYDELFEEVEAHRERFLGLWQRVAEHYRDHPESLVFELLHQPSGDLDVATWNELSQAAIARIRESNPDRWLIVDSAEYSAVDSLELLELPGDDHLAASFHYYEPQPFTLQGWFFASDEFSTRGILFPGPPEEPVTPSDAAAQHDWVVEWLEDYNTLPQDENPSGPAPVAEAFALVEGFIERTGTPVYLGEFGVVQNADEGSRENYLKLVRKEAERRNIAWSVWNDGGDFQVMDPGLGRWRSFVRRALFD